MPRTKLGKDVFQTAIERMIPLYEQGHRIVVSFSAGKDSGVCLEICAIAAAMTGRLPVEVLMRDEEIMLPGTFEYAERIAERQDVKFYWIIANQPIVNIYNRVMPYFWVFDPLLPPEKWVRQPPSWATYIEDKNIQRLTIPERFPPPEGKDLMAVIGLRTSESRGRLLGIHSSKGYITGHMGTGTKNVRPIYDWSDGDVWKAIHDHKWDYNHAYDILVKMGVRKGSLRIAPPTLNVHGVDGLRAAAKAWPQWFDRVCERLPGARSAANFGKRAVLPIKRHDESWEQCYKRECIKEAPAWIAERSVMAMEKQLHAHSCHSSEPYPDVNGCRHCGAYGGCWRNLAAFMYCGDPFSLKFDFLPYVEPEFFRPGAGTWNGTPSFT